MIIQSFLTKEGNRVTVMPGDLILVHRKGPVKNINTFLAHMIRKITKNYYNHAANVCESMEDLYVTEAVEDGYYATKTVQELFDSLGKEYEILIKRKAVINYPTYYERVRYFISANYDYKATLFDQLIYWLFDKWIGKTGEDSDKVVNCSEVVAKIYKEDFPHGYRMAPVHLYCYTKDWQTIYESDPTGRLIFNTKQKNSICK